MAEIVLPIKCSTVKRFNSLVESVIKSEIVVLIIVWVMWSIIWYTSMISNPPNDGGNTLFGGMLFIIAAFGIATPIVVGAAVISTEIIPKIPVITCIKDEETP